jgi:hypothetical protein
VPDNGSCKLKHVAQCYMTLKCCVGRCILFVSICEAYDHDIGKEIWYMCALCTCMHVCVCVREGRGTFVPCLCPPLYDPNDRQINTKNCCKYQMCRIRRNLLYNQRVPQLIWLFLRSIVGVMTGVWPGRLRNYGLIYSRGEIFISSLKNLNHLWGLNALVLNE